MSHNPPRGPGKGPGNESAAKPFGTAQDAKAASDKGVAERVTARERMRLWREEHPEWQAKPGAVSKKDLREYFNGIAPDAIDRIDAIVQDPEHAKHAEVILKVVEHALGRPTQAVELSGPDGDAVELKGYVVTPVVAASMEEWTAQAKPQDGAPEDE